MKRFKIQFFISAIFVTILLGLFLSFDFYLQKVSTEFMNSWLKTEEINLKEGNYLSSIAKNQRFIFTSQFVKGVTLFEDSLNESAPKILASFGETIIKNNFALNKRSGMIFLIRDGFFHYISLYRFPEKPDLVVLFNINPIMIKYLFLMVSFFLISLLMFFYFAIRILQRKEVSNRLELIKAAIKDLTLTKKPGEFLLKEVPNLANSWFEMVNLVEDLKEKEKKYYGQVQLNELATQVAHDIRSPLASLKMSTREISYLTEDKRMIIRGSVNRIEDIANSLLEKFKLMKKEEENGRINKNTEEPLNIQLISTVLESIISEKRVQLRSRIGLDIEFNPDINSYGLFSKIQASTLRRVISNLLNNSIEAVGNRGKIEVSLSNHEYKILIKIKDNGKGISPEVLPLLCQKGNSFGKKSGHGLGLYHAKTSIESWNGTFQIDSVLGEGTTITVLLPIENEPLWFVPKLNIFEGGKIVILDDDTTIHKIWDEKFSKAKVQDNGIEVFHFSSLESITKWLSCCENKLDAKIVYLIDYELLGSSVTGLNIIENAGIASQSILVTSRFEEEKIRKSCEKLNVGLIPKTMAEFIPIEIFKPNMKIEMGMKNQQKEYFKVEDSEFDVVYVDNDEYLRWGWKKSAKENGLRLLDLSSPKQFEKYSTRISKNTFFYIDNDLGKDEIKGEEWAKVLFDNGYVNLFLATGYDNSYFSNLSYLKGIIGKDPPWEGRDV